MFGKKKNSKFKKAFSDDFDEEAEDIATHSDEESDGEAADEQVPILPVQGILPVKEIYKGMIVTTDDRYLKILEVLPINFALRSAEEQDNIVYLFSSWLRVAPSKIQFKIVTRRADSFEIINNVRAATEAETHPKCRALAENYIKFIQDVSGAEALSRRFFLIFEYEEKSRRTKTIDDIAAEMEDTAYKIRGGLAACGNEVITPKNDDFFQAEALYTFYNRESSTKEPFADRVLRVTSDTMKTMGLRPECDPYPDIPVVNYIAPRGIDFTHSDYYICDGLYHSIMYIKRDGYPNAVYGGWMSSLIESGDGIDVDIILRKEDRTRTKEKVALKLKFNRIKASGRSDTDTDFEEIEGAIQSSAYIKDCLASGEDFYHMYTFITVSAPTHDDMLKSKEAVADMLFSRDISTKDVRFRLEDAFQVVSPLLTYRKELMDFASRNVMTRGAASMYPFTSCELCDEKGIVLGINRRYASLVNIDIFDTKKYKNANIAILGTSGSGKTFCELTMALRMRIQGIQTFIIAPDKAHEFQRACSHIGGSYIRISPGAQTCINVMEIRPVVSPIAEFLEEDDAMERDSWLSQKTSQLLTFFHILIPELTNEEEQLVDEAIIKTYNSFGITHDNQSVFLDPKKKILRPMPIIGDLYDVLRENPDTRHVANIVGRFVTGSAASFNRQTNVDLTNKFIVFDLQDLQGTMKAVGMFICMDFLWSRIKENRTDRKAIFIDEGWQLIGASSDSRAADFVYRIFKIIRGFGGAAIFATQDLSDLFSFQDGKYGKAIISNSKIKIVLGMENQEAKYVQETLQLTKNELRSITNFNRGEALLCANNNKMEVFIRASQLEEELITTDPAQLKAIVERRKAELYQAEIAKQFTMHPSGESTTSESQDPPESCEDQPASQEKMIEMSKDARMSMWAMEQLSSLETKDIPDGETEAYEYDPPLVRVESEEAETFKDEVLGVQIPSPNRPKDVAQAAKTPANIDEDLLDMPQASDEDISKIQKRGAEKNVVNYPPAEF